MIQILIRRGKTTPSCWGARVGKTAVAEGLAQKMALGQVPDALRQKSGCWPWTSLGDRRHQVPGGLRSG